MKAHGIYQGATARETSSKGDKSDKVDGTGSKKRKTDKVDKSNSTSDTEEVNPKKKVKDEVNGPVANRSGKIKTEFEYTSPDNDNFFHFTPVNDGSPSVEDDTFSEFLNSAAFETINGPSRFNDVQSGVEDMSPRGGDFLGGVGMGPNAGQFMPVADENQSSIIIDE